MQKKGVKARKHGIIYELGKKPRMLENEPKLGYAPVAMEIYEKGEKVSKESRVNYSKLVTIEHNVKVLFIGRIISEDFGSVVTKAVDRCWAERVT